MNIPISEAKANFAEIVRRAEAGEEIVLTRNGKAVAKISDIDGKPELRARRKSFLGAFEGKGWIAEDFNEYLPPEFDEYT